LAVCKALKNKEIKRIILARPAVEAGEVWVSCQVIQREN
jgi:phosphate starvation-inducible protein PhoH